jgi:hypothetical protein
MYGFKKERTYCSQNVLHVHLESCLPHFTCKKTSEAYEITKLSVCPSLITFEPTGRAIEGGLAVIIFNHVASTIPTWRTLKLLRWMQNLHQSTRDHEGLSGNHGNHTILM